MNTQTSTWAECPNQAGCPSSLKPVSRRKRGCHVWPSTAPFIADLILNCIQQKQAFPGDGSSREQHRDTKPYLSHWFSVLSEVSWVHSGSYWRSAHNTKAPTPLAFLLAKTEWTQRPRYYSSCDGASGSGRRPNSWQQARFLHCCWPCYIWPVDWTSVSN